MPKKLRTAVLEETSSRAMRPTLSQRPREARPYRAGPLRQQTREKTHPMNPNQASFIGIALGALTGFGLMACGPAGNTPGGDNAGIHAEEQVVGEAAEPYLWPAAPSDVVNLNIPEYGTIRIGLYAQLAPKTVAHFLDLSRRGVYDGTPFHRVIEDFMIQGGNPNNRVSSEGMKDWGSLKVEDEFNSAQHLRGVVSMANRGRPDTAETEFFIVHRDMLDLDGRYTAFGRVLGGLEVLDKIAATETDEFGRWGEKAKPLEAVVLEGVRVEGVGAEGVVGEVKEEGLGVDGDMVRRLKDAGLRADGDVVRGSTGKVLGDEGFSSGGLALGDSPR